MFLHQFMWAVILFVLFLIGYFLLRVFYPLWRFLEQATTAIELYDIMMTFIRKEFDTQNEQIQVKHRRYLLAFSNTSEACLAYSDLINQALKAYSRIGFSYDDPEIDTKKRELEKILAELQKRKEQLENNTRKDELKT